ncbi:peptide-methionine (R)-S-oxide reductase MsrB [Roseiconus nitratireducens]|uniref:peptide-methionine (R)-S-oxide reductase n=2 Tax=Roseiconus nitratireducens TaxID=2605748 RepID=A0A5M6DC34_9BACT|nr:peptide-methionine (R)-S-oxide reductase MsrB [Roseiconus nitratireducens]
MQLERAGDQEPKIKDPPYTPKSTRELARELTPMQFKVTQKEETEPAFRNEYWDNKKDGVYRCIVCGQALFSSDTKYKSGTGWPSFYDPIEKQKVGFKTDNYLFYTRIEVHCSRCNAHLGHVFDDGPRDKTGKRYCMNSAALKFEPKPASKADAPSTETEDGTTDTGEQSADEQAGSEQAEDDQTAGQSATVEDVAARRSSAPSQRVDF